MKKYGARGCRVGKFWTVPAPTGVLVLVAPVPSHGIPHRGVATGGGGGGLALPDLALPPSYTLISVTGIGVATRGTGDASPRFNIMGGRPLRIRDF